MHTRFLVPTLLLGLAACGSDVPTDAPSRAVPNLAVEDLPGGSAAYLSCVWGGGNFYNEGAHFEPNPPPFTFYDPVSRLAGQCGDLDFDDRVRSFKTAYASHFVDESPYKYWWRRYRVANTGLTTVDLGKKDTAVAGAPVTDSVLVPLVGNQDAIGALLVLTANGNLQPTDSAFTDVNWAYHAGINLVIQHWAHIPAPTLDSAVGSGPTVTLYWHNHHNDRLIDSTYVFRSNQTAAITQLDHTRTTFSDAPGPGTYTYTLKHKNVPVFTAVPDWLGAPNSDSSNAKTVTLGTACAVQEYGSTWQVSDQYLSAGCSELGTNKRFRWLTAAGGVLKTWSADTLYDFPGHSQTGAQVVILEDSNTTTGQKSRDTLAFGVSAGQVVLTGPTYVVDKGKKIYRATAAGAPHWGQWFERYTDGPQWFPATAYEQDTLPRIWPAGRYTVTLRQHKVSSGVLHRGRLVIDVCNTSGCRAAPPALRADAQAPPPASDWGLLGAGPWLSASPGGVRRMLRLYDLWGQHDGATAFVDGTWLDGVGGRDRDPGTGWEVSWQPRDLGLADVRALDLAVAGTGGDAYVFSLAVDPDLGLDASDDVASYDAGRGLLLVADGERAVGFLLRDARGNALASVQEYGVGRFAPTTADYAWTAQRLSGVQLVGTPRDVQLVLSVAARSALGSWRFVVLRGASVDQVQLLADAVLRALR